MYEKLRTSTVATVVAAALALTACAPGDGRAETDGVYTGSYGGDALALSDPVTGGAVTIGMSLAVVSLDSATGVVGGIAVASAVYGHLLEVRPDGTIGEGIALGAETADNTNWTLHLREGVTFSDGTPFDAEAVIAHVQRVGAEDSTSLSATDARNVISMAAPDELTVEFELAVPSRQFDLLLADGALSLVGSPTAVEERGSDFGVRPVGAGPFVVDSFTPDGDISLSRNESYFIDGLPYLDSVLLTPVTDTQSRIAALAAGDIDIASVPELVALEDAEAYGLTTLVQPSYQQYLIQPNVANEYLGDVRVRRAISHAIDRDAINAVIFNGLHQPATSLLSGENPYYVDTTWPLYDPAEAEALVEEYKAETSNTEIGFTLMVNQEPASSQIATLLQQQLAEVGIVLSIEVLDPTAQLGNVIAGTFDAMLQPRAFPAETTSSLSQAFGGGSFLNFGSGSNPDFDALVVKISETTTDEERLAIVPEMLDVLTEWVPAIPVIGSGIGRIVSDRVAGFPDGDPNATSIEAFDLRQVWVLPGE